jgi:flagellar biogenesis protein FliO
MPARTIYLTVALLLSVALAEPTLAQQRPMTLEKPATKSNASREGKTPLPAKKLPPKSTAAKEKKSLPLSSSTGQAMTTVLTGLGIVIGLFLAFAWLTKRAAPKSMQALPGEVVEILGRAPLNSKQQMQLVRLGNRLLLLAMSTDSAETLAEISDPAEVDRITAICRQNAPGSVTDTFRQVLAELGNTPARGGFVDARERSNSRLRTTA